MVMWGHTHYQKRVDLLILLDGKPYLQEFYLKLPRVYCTCKACMGRYMRKRINQQNYKWGISHVVMPDNAIPHMNTSLDTACDILHFWDSLRPIIGAKRLTVRKLKDAIKNSSELLQMKALYEQEWESFLALALSRGVQSLLTSLRTLLSNAEIITRTHQDNCPEELRNCQEPTPLDNIAFTRLSTTTVEQVVETKNDSESESGGEIDADTTAQSKQEPNPEPESELPQSKEINKKSSNYLAYIIRTCCSRSVFGLTTYVYTSLSILVANMATSNTTGPPIAPIN